MTLRQGKRLSVCQTITESAPSGRTTSGRVGSIIRTLPSVATSSPPMTWTRVLLPQPLGPSRHEKRRDANRCEKFSSATIGSSPRPGQACVTFSTDTSIAQGTRIFRYCRHAGSSRPLNPAASRALLPIFSASLMTRSPSLKRGNTPSTITRRASLPLPAPTNVEIGR